MTEKIFEPFFTTKQAAREPAWAFDQLRHRQRLPWQHPVKPHESAGPVYPGISRSGNSAWKKDPLGR